MKKVIISSILIFLLLPIELTAQEFQRKDSLRGSITKERAWWDLLHYDIDVVCTVIDKVSYEETTVEKSFEKIFFGKKRNYELPMPLNVHDARKKKMNNNNKKNKICRKN